MENTLWDLVAFGTTGAETPIIEGSAINLLLAAGQAGGSGGCNAYGGTYQVDGDSISFGEITSTLLACENQQITEQEQRYIAALQTASQYAIEGDQLRVSYDNGAGQLIFERALQPAPTMETPTS
jgi:heat shock protein HslJ